MKTGLITSDTYQNHNTGDGHPEKIDRVTAVIDNFKKIDNKKLIWKKPAKFDQSFLINTHSTEYVDLVSKSFPKNGLAFLDGDTVVSPGSKEATKDAVGSIITAIDGVENKEFKKAFKEFNTIKYPDNIIFSGKSAYVYREKGIKYPNILRYEGYEIWLLYFYNKNIIDIDVDFILKLCGFGKSITEIGKQYIEGLIPFLEDEIKNSRL